MDFFVKPFVHDHGILLLVFIAHGIFHSQSIGGRAVTMQYRSGTLVLLKECGWSMLLYSKLVDNHSREVKLQLDVPAILGRWKSCVYKYQSFPQ